MQFMRAVHSEEALAVKFFFKRHAFDAEVELYRDPVLRGMMPATRAFVGNDASDERSAGGYAWPPCIIIERGESLQEWHRREGEDFITTVQVPALPIAPTLPLKLEPVHVLCFRNASSFRPRALFVSRI